MAEYFQMPSTTGDGPWVVKYQDMILPKLDDIDAVQAITFAKELKYNSGDISLCTYPKCGTHWIGNMIWKLKTLENSNRPKDTILEFGPPEVFENMESPRIIFTHVRPSRLPTEHVQNRGKIVLMLRNPKDVIVSSYYHAKNMAFTKCNHTWDDMFQAHTTGIIPFGSYFDYIQQWEEFLRENPEQQVEIFYYEDFKANLDDNLTRLNKFLGFNRDQEFIEKVKEATTMSALRQQDAAGMRDTIITVRDEKGDSVIYRKGVVGDWKKHFSVAQSELVDKLMEKRITYGFINIKYSI